MISTRSWNILFLQIYGVHAPFADFEMRLERTFAVGALAHFAYFEMSLERTDVTYLRCLRSLC